VIGIKGRHDKHFSLDMGHRENRRIIWSFGASHDREHKDRQPQKLLHVAFVCKEPARENVKTSQFTPTRLALRSDAAFEVVIVHRTVDF
jgi:hypothetical protein